MPERDAMDDNPGKRLSGLDPAELLRQGAADDTFTESASGGCTPPTPEELAAIFPRFEVLELIGKGEMGAVYKVRQPELDRIVALKILHPEIGDTESFSTRFTREAKALAKLSHPGIVTIHESGHEGDLYYFLMEYVDGVNLRQLLENGRISPREAMAIVPQICDSLQFAHDQRIVHRDIKPENLLIDRLGRVKVADFGIAKLIGSDDPATTSIRSEGSMFTDGGKILGTPQYMAPEQGSMPSEVDHRADIFALGVVFYQMLTGELPEKNLQPPSRKISLDVRLDEVVLRALEKDPKRRFSSATDMRTGIESIGNSGNPSDHRVKATKNSTAKVLAIVAVILLIMIVIPIIVGLTLFFSYSSKETANGSSRMKSQPFDSIEVVTPEPGIWAIARFFSEDEMTVIDLLGRRVTPLGDQLLEEVELPPFSVSYHTVRDVDRTTGQTTKVRHFLNSRAESFSITTEPTGLLRTFPDHGTRWESTSEDEYGTTSVQVDRCIGSWYGFRIVAAGGRTAYGSFRISPSESPVFQWTYLGGKTLEQLENEQNAKVGKSLEIQIGERTPALLEGTATDDATILKAVERSIALNPGLQILLRADPSLPHAKAVEWMKCLSALGVEEIELATIEKQKWPDEAMPIRFDLGGETMQNIVSRLRRDFAFAICFENLAFDPKTDAITLGQRISELQKAKKSRELTRKESQLLEQALKSRSERGLGDETLIDVGDRFEGTIEAIGIADFLDQHTNSLPGVPDGEYFLLQFETKFADKEDAVETLTLINGEEGNWGVASYFIR